MNSYLKKFFSNECKFINNLTSKIITVIQKCGTNYLPVEDGKKVKGKQLEYTTDVVSTDVYTLTIEGYIYYLYYQVYGTGYPEIITPEEAEKIYAIYDALFIPRPIL